MSALAATVVDVLLSVVPHRHTCGNFPDGPVRACLACASSQLTRPGPGSCPVCAQRLAHSELCRNELCRNPGRRISRIHAIGYQTGPLRRAINSYKYRGDGTWSAVFGRLLLAWLEENMAADPPGLIVVNPTFIGPAGLEFGHTEAVLAAAARADGCSRWPFDTASPAAIIKTRATLKSADGQAWSKRATGQELRQALHVPKPGRIAGKFVLVYDDVCATGTQLDVVAGCLLDHGDAARVEAVVLARAPWRR